MFLLIQTFKVSSESLFRNYKKYNKSQGELYTFIVIHTRSDSRDMYYALQYVNK